ncbi:MAG: tetratricopeptide repeat protein, partial [Nitrospiria bacterium]
GLVEEGRGRWEAAERRYRRALPLRPSDPDVHYKLGWLAARAGQSHDAEAEYLAALRLAPTHVFAHLELARLADEQGRSADATQRYRQALAVMPADGQWSAVRRTVEERLRALRRPLPAAPR